MKEHGQYIFDRSEQVVLFAGRGPWNSVALRNGSQELSEVIAQIEQTKAWAQLSILYGESVMPPDTYERFVRRTKGRNVLGLSALAIVIKDSDVSSIIKRQLSAAYEQANIKHVFFDEIEPARQWLEQQSFPIVEQALQAFFTRCDFIK